MRKCERHSAFHRRAQHERILLLGRRSFLLGTDQRNGRNPLQPFSECYELDPRQPPGPVTLLTSALGKFPTGIAYDGHNIWTTSQIPGAVSIITLNSSGPPTITQVTNGFGFALTGIVYDGANIWVTDQTNSGHKIDKLDSSGAIILSADLGDGPQCPAFDGTNIWVPNNTSHTVNVVRATGGLAGTVIATLTGNGLANPVQAAFDGERILVTNFTGNSVSLWNASDLTPIGTFSIGNGNGPLGVCSDGTNFWIALETANKLARF